MKHYWVLLLILTALFLSGCKKNESHAATTTATNGTAPSSTATLVTTAPTDHRPIIVAFGDSLTAGYGADPGDSYPDFLQKELDNIGYRYRVVNAGISGDTTKDGIERLQDVLALKPALVIVAFGGNDGLRGLPLSYTKENLDRIIQTLKDSGAKVVLGGITLPRNYGPDYIRQFNAIYAEAAKKYDLPWTPFLLHDVYGVPGRMQEDGIHATAEGNKQVAQNLLTLVKPLLKKSY